jgi:hypothetical protein
MYIQITGISQMRGTLIGICGRLEPAAATRQRSRMTSYARYSPASPRTAAPIITSLVRDGAFCNAFLEGFVLFFLAPIALLGSHSAGIGAARSRSP